MLVHIVSTTCAGLDTSTSSVAGRPGFDMYVQELYGEDKKKVIIPVSSNRLDGVVNLSLNLPPILIPISPDTIGAQTLEEEEAGPRGGWWSW